MTKIVGTLLLLLLPFTGYATGSAIDYQDQPDRPNILLIIADDVTYKDLSLYGGQNVKTPQIDKLAEQGVVFEQAFISTSMCEPARAALYTGLYPMRNGIAWNHSDARSETKSVTHYFREAGYRVGIAGKIHVSPQHVFPFTKVKGVERSAVSETAAFSSRGIQDFMNREKESPFFLTVGLNSAHVPWTAGAPDAIDQTTIKFPPNLADTKATRRDYARYLAEIKVLDRQVGKTLDALKKAGKEENTIVIFTSEQGSQFPGNKWTNWNSGVHTGMVWRWSGKVESGRRTEALVQYVDVLPTLLEAVGEPTDKQAFDGSSFLKVLQGDSDTHRDYAFFMHNNIPEGPSYPIRGVTDGTFHYLHNLKPENLYVEKHLMGKQEKSYWHSWLFNATTSSRTYQLVQRYLNRPQEELYNNEKDPYNLTNLSGDPQFTMVKEELRKALAAWMIRQGDPGAILDSWEQLKAARGGNHIEVR